MAGTPPPESAGAAGAFLQAQQGRHHQTSQDQQLHDKCDMKTIQKTCSLFGLDPERPPPVPPSRSYTVTGNRKIAYPQSRVMKNSFPGDYDDDNDDSDCDCGND